MTKEIPDQEFADKIYQALTEQNIPEQSFRDEFGLTLGAVHRWTTLKNLPQPLIRASILEWIDAQNQ